ncbi:class I SAM-dependent methyltransferase [Mycolicibacterium sp.]|uniref:class I SAM-dependent methyltransferase n=1 Tax=Mycolicibacterium sp. TaxID=2320850 RepID=UPI0037CA7821
MRLLSKPRPEYVEQCLSCDSTFFYFGAANVVSHKELYSNENLYQDYLDVANKPSQDQRYGEAIDRIKMMLSGVDSPTIFDVGAGAGDFLIKARDQGFRIAGNEVSRPAIEECQRRHGIELSLGDNLHAIAKNANGYDAVTMWCVIAHVDDPEQLLQGVKALLRPGGVLFLSTPRYCAIDRIAMVLRTLTGDRYRRIFDRRINRGHRRQYSRRGMEAFLRREGFVPVAVEPAIGYGLHMAAYLNSVGLPTLISKMVGQILELLAMKGLLPRNVLNVYAKSL